MFGVEQVSGSGAVTVKISGDIDLATADKVGDALAAALGSSANVRVDLSGVTFLDSTGIRALVQAYRLASSKGGSLHVFGAKHWVAKVLDVTGVGPLLSAPAE